MREPQGEALRLFDPPKPDIKPSKPFPRTLRANYDHPIVFEDPFLATGVKDPRLIEIMKQFKPNQINEITFRVPVKFEVHEKEDIVYSEKVSKTRRILVAIIDEENPFNGISRYLERQTFIRKVPEENSDQKEVDLRDAYDDSPF